MHGQPHIRFALFCLSFCIIFISLSVVKCNLQHMLVFPSCGRGCNSEVVQAVDRFGTPAPLRKPHPAGTAKGCRGAARDFFGGSPGGPQQQHTHILQNTAQ